MIKREYSFDNSKDESSYEQGPIRDIKSNSFRDSDQEIKQLIKTKENFEHFIITLGPNANLTLSPANVRYSKQILEGNFDGHQISLLVESRVQKMIKNHKIKKNWCKQDCTILAWVLERITNGRHLRSPQKLKMNHWETAAGVIPGATAQECMFKWLSMKKTKLGNNKWSQTESKILQKVVKEIGTQDWKKISRLLYYQNPSEDKKYRHPKQCREQWNCYLNPALKKGPWNVDEDLSLLRLVEREGRKWSNICKKMVGRTQNALKNRYNFLIQHKKGKYPDESQQNLLKKCLSELEQIHLLSGSTQKSSSQASAEQNCKETQRVVTVKLQHNPQIIKVQQENIPQQVTIVECNYEQLTKFLRMNHILIPARIERNQLISYEGESQKSMMKIMYNQ